MALAASAAALLALALLLDAYIIVVPISSTSESSLSSSHHLAQIHVHVAGRAVEELVSWSSLVVKLQVQHHRQVE